MSVEAEQVAYGATDLSQQAIAFRRANGIKGARNVAVLEYRDNAGQLKTLVRVSDRNQGKHAEQRLVEVLDEAGIRPASVTRIYSELEPCSLPGRFCKRLLARRFPQAAVSYSFEYGETKASRLTGITQLKDVIKTLGD